MEATSCPADLHLPRREFVSQAFLQSGAWGRAESGGQGGTALPCPTIFLLVLQEKPQGRGPQSLTAQPLAASSQTGGGFLALMAIFSPCVCSCSCPGFSLSLSTAPEGRRAGHYRVTGKPAEAQE